jgi:hypothetical protein
MKQKPRRDDRKPAHRASSSVPAGTPFFLGCSESPMMNRGAVFSRPPGLGYRTLRRFVAALGGE